MALFKKKFLAPFGVDSGDDSIFRKAVQILGDLSFQTGGRLIIPEGDSSTGVVNQFRVNSGTDEAEVFRTGRWVPVVTSAMRYNATDNQFLGNTGTEEVILPHVSNTDNYLKNVALYHANERGSASAPAYGFSLDSNIGMYSPAVNSLAFSIDGVNRLAMAPDTCVISYDGATVFAANRTAVTVGKPMTCSSSVALQDVLSVAERATMAKGVTVTDGGIQIDSGDLTVAGSGRLVAGGNVVAFSDKRIKTEIETIENALEKVCQFRGVLFHNEVNGQYEVGTIAQEVEKAVPELVQTTDIQLKIGEETVDNVKTVAYMNMVGLLVQAVKELKEQVEELKSQK